MRRLLVKGVFAAHLEPGVKFNGTDSGHWDLCDSHAVYMWAHPVFREHVTRLLTECHAATFSFRTLPSGASRLSWDVLFLAAHGYERWGDRDRAEAAYGKALDISRAERDLVAGDTAGEDHVATQPLALHHRMCSEAALAWDPPNTDLAQQVMDLGESAVAVVWLCDWRCKVVEALQGGGTVVVWLCSRLCVWFVCLCVYCFVFQSMCRGGQY